MSGHAKNEYTFSPTHVCICYTPLPPSVVCTLVPVPSLSAFLACFWCSHVQFMLGGAGHECTPCVHSLSDSSMINVAVSDLLAHRAY
jgi:hypothetical protein